MIAETLSVGTELLLGQIVDTNAAYIAQALSSIGVALYHRTTVGDNDVRIRDAVRQALSRSDVLITIGGLGPTMDDLTKEMVCEVMGVPLVEDAEARRRLDGFARGRGFASDASFFKQALLPGAGFGGGIPNPNGTAPGVFAEKDGKIAICLPGPPNELIPMMEQTVVPTLSERTSGERTVILSRVLRIVGIGESKVEDLTKDLLLSNNPTVAPLAKLGECHLRITARAGSEAAAESLIAPREKALRERLGNAVYGIDAQTLEEVVVDLLKQQGKTLAIAESCTGGLVAHRITSVPGASDVFHTGIVSYSNEAKERLLGVREATLAAHGAVSPETAIEMAEGARVRDGASIGVGITGVAGPAGGTAKKPVGLVYIAVTAEGREPLVDRINFGGARLDIIRRSAHFALAAVRTMLIAN